MTINPATVRMTRGNVLLRRKREGKVGKLSVYIASERWWRVEAVHRDSWLRVGDWVILAPGSIRHDLDANLCVTPDGYAELAYRGGEAVPKPGCVLVEYPADQDYGRFVVPEQYQEQVRQGVLLTAGRTGEQAGARVAIDLNLPQFLFRRDGALHGVVPEKALVAVLEGSDGQA